MGKVWVLDTGTKGTGAEMVPLEKVLKEPAPSAEPRFDVPPVRKPEPVRVYTWQPRARRWRLLTVAEQRAMWALRCS